MENIFDRLMEQRINYFIESFVNSSKELFLKDGKLIHAGEYGMTRERLCANFISEFLPSIYETGNGFIINNNGEISKQCDLIIYDKNYTPLLSDAVNTRFFTVETCVAIGEIKSILTKSDLETALFKIAENCKIRRHNSNNSFIRKFNTNAKFNPKNDPYDRLFSFLVCEKFDFDTSDLANEFARLSKEIEQHFRCNMILSLKDGLLTYYIDLPQRGNKKMTMQYSLENDVKTLFVEDSNNLIPCKLFMSYLYNSVVQTTVLHPDMVTYINDFNGQKLHYGQNR